LFGVGSLFIPNCCVLNHVNVKILCNVVEFPLSIKSSYCSVIGR